MWWLSLTQYTQTEETNTRMHKDRDPRRPPDGQMAQQPNQRIPRLMRQSCWSPSLPHAVRQPQRVPPSSEETLSAAQDQQRHSRSPPPPPTSGSIPSVGWLSARNLTPTSDLSSVLTVWRRHNETKTNRPKLKTSHLFLPLNLRAGELERRSPCLHMAPWFGGGGRRRVRLLTSLRTEGTLCNHRRLTEGRAEWFYLPVLTKAVESKFTGRAPWLFNFRHSQ